MTKLQLIVCKLFGIKPVASKVNVNYNDPTKCENLIEFRADDSFKRALPTLYKGDECIVGFSQEVIQFRHVPLGCAGKCALMKRTYVIEITETDWGD